MPAPSPRTIRITKGLAASSKVFAHYDLAAALEVVAKEANLYEITSETTNDPVRLYGDIDLYAATKPEAVALDKKIEKALRVVLPSPLCLMTATGDDHNKRNERGKRWKVSWRFVVPHLFASQAAVKRHAMENIEPQLVEQLKNSGVPMTAVLDASVYDRAKKMRMVGSSKDNEDRPLRIICGTVEDSLITHITDDCVEIEQPQNIITETATPASECSDPATPTVPKPRNEGELDERTWNFVNDLCELVPMSMLDDYKQCVEFIWSLWNEEQSVRMLELINKTCSRSAKYKQADSNGKAGKAWVQEKVNEEQNGKKRIGSVIFHAQKANAAAVKALHRKYPRTYLDELFGQSLKPANVVEYDSRYVKPLPIGKFDTIILASPLGTGKTVVLMGSKKLNIQGLLGEHLTNELVAVDGTLEMKVITGEMKYPRVLFVSGRKSFTNFAMGELKEQGIAFETYSEHQGERLAAIDRLFIQVESLWKLADGFKSYDLVIVDESETITHQLHSIETNRDNMIDNHIIFERVVASAKKVIVADAFISDRSFSFIKELRNPERTVYINNKHQPYKRTAIELQPNGGDARVPNTGLFVMRIMDAIKAKRRIVIVWTSKRKGLAFEKDYLEPMRAAGLRWKFYHGDSTKAERADLANVSEAWGSLDVLMYSTSISVGISYDVPEEAKQFDEAFLWAAAASATPRDIAQSLLRCRKLKANRLTYVIDGRCMPPMVRGLDLLREYVIEKKKRIQTDHPVIQWKTAPQWAEDNYLYNENESRVSKAEYGDVLRFYLRWCGYTVKKEGGEAKDFNITNIDGAAFDEIDVIDRWQAEEIKGKMQRDEAEPAERLAYKKYKFLSALKAESHDNGEAEEIWNDYMENITDERHFWNMVREKHTTTDATAKVEAEKRYLTMAAHHIEARTTLDKVLKLLSMTHTQEAKVIAGEDFQKLVAAGERLDKEVRGVFGIRKSQRKAGQPYDVAALHDMLGSVWNSWSGGKINTINKHRITVDKKRVYVYDYQFVPRAAWNIITDKEVEEVEGEKPKEPVYGFIDE
jgi:hypothetical protein